MRRIPPNGHLVRRPVMGVAVPSPRSCSAWPRRREPLDKARIPQRSQPLRRVRGGDDCRRRRALATRGDVLRHQRRAPDLSDLHVVRGKCRSNRSSILKADAVRRCGFSHTPCGMSFTRTFQKAGLSAGPRLRREPRLGARRARLAACTRCSLAQLAPASQEPPREPLARPRDRLRARPHVRPRRRGPLGPAVRPALRR